jgi:hypothetical protein
VLLQELPEQQAGRASADDGDLSAHGSPLFLAPESWP